MKKRTLKEDDAILYKNIIGTVGIKGISIIVSFFTTSLYVSYFQDSGTLGIWFTLLSILQWILTFDFGIGNGLRNKLTPYLEKKDDREIKEYISSGYIALLLVTVAVATIGGLLIVTQNWNNLFNIADGEIDNHALKITVLVTFVGILMQFVLKIITSILYALRKNILANLTVLCSNMLLCVFLTCGRFWPLESDHKLILLSIAYAATVILPLIVATILVFFTDLKGYFPSYRYFNKVKAKEVISLGGSFFIIQLELLILTSTDSWFIMRLFSSEDVVSYQIYYKLFSLPTTMFALLSQPLWSSITVALAKLDIEWIKKKEKQIYIVAVAVSVSCIIEVGLSSRIIEMWIGTQNCDIAISSAVWFGILSIGQLFMYASTSIANGISKLGCQVICNLIAVILKFTLTFYFAGIMAQWISIIMVEAIGTWLIAIIQPIVNKYNLNHIKIQ